VISLIILREIQASANGFVVVEPSQGSAAAAGQPFAIAPH